MASGKILLDHSPPESMSKYVGENRDKYNCHNIFLFLHKNNDNANNVSQITSIYSIHFKGNNSKCH